MRCACAAGFIGPVHKLRCPETSERVLTSVGPLGGRVRVLSYLFICKGLFRAPSGALQQLPRPAHCPWLPAVREGLRALPLTARATVAGTQPVWPCDSQASGISCKAGRGNTRLGTFRPLRPLARTAPGSPLSDLQARHRTQGKPERQGWLVPQHNPPCTTCPRRARRTPTHPPHLVCVHHHRLTTSTSATHPARTAPSPAPARAARPHGPAPRWRPSARAGPRSAAAPRPPACRAARRRRRAACGG